MSNNSADNEIERIVQRIASLNLEKQQLEDRLETLQSFTARRDNKREDITTKVTASDLAARTGVHIPPKYHQFANLVLEDKTGKRLYVGDEVLVHTRGNRSKQTATVAYLTEYKVTVLYPNGVKASREASYLQIVKSYNRQGKPL